MVHAMVASMPCGVGGGATYDALIAATAQHHEHRLLTADRRARATYDALGVDYEVVDLEVATA
ncbi:PIN domain-containing protein [Nocardioides sp. DS6]|uniref:PIN domain-containing protein n=1 Tax=Nocardioides eburneus TaxID=3231482 RepID=A0ABV3SY50_9ACTN